ncbi:hypothetical protein NE237_033045 [Protea cynaroides]|uniref:B3 domain-containing protein n=1 Tax=Protea cynaroides TaxID=273540 RepID=A0A9Q0L447_9MAGN|nr:hypothetical protein NE237_033045 [Protea cynaroides]
MRFRNHWKALKEMVAVELESLGINPNAVSNNQEETKKFITRKRHQSLEIETKNKKIKKTENNIASLVLDPKRERRTTKMEEDTRPQSTPRRMPDEFLNSIHKYGGDDVRRVMHKHAASSSSSSSILEDKIKKEKLKPKPMKKKAINPPVAPCRPAPPRPSAATLLAMPPVMLMNAIRELGGEDLVSVIEKPLSATDCCKHQSRFSIPEKKVRVEDFITEEERKLVDTNNYKIPVSVLLLVNGGVDDDAHHHDVVQSWRFNFTKWKMNSSCIYVLTTHWWGLIGHNNLKPGDKFQVWSFRTSQNGKENKKLWFAINALPE